MAKEAKQINVSNNQINNLEKRDLLTSKLKKKCFKKNV